ncbi:NACHT domain-containing protein [Allokutzneria sp. A3M-2-11 16]|uniref:NACHT domain-containing protein n=1 Tax=Allokutzneria sp. A3M-2-11 16 TaxID=2962043 RepID=UPI0020B85D29|nr:NACHT domain-containing protein [Allokutzneria sp. A3M-2-11 16]MCP3805448.1 NACHT domain-containing protein [Allokutzneria sp. A3M-2-11 16]
MDLWSWLFIGALTGGVALLFIPKELWKRWRARLVEHTDQILRRKVTRFGRRYRQFVLDSLRFVDLKGLATVGYYTPELDEVFVDVSLAYRAPHQVSESVLADLPTDVTHRHSIGHFLDREEAVVLAVTGSPGSGKTTLLRHTARSISRSPRGRRRTVPILLYLRDHVSAIVGNHDISVPALLRTSLGHYRTVEPPGWFEQRLRDGDCVVLLDGLDEVSRQEDRRKVADWVESQARQYSKNDFVITSRPRGFRSASVEGAVVVQVRSFTEEQVTLFVRGWYRAVERHQPDHQGLADDLLRRLHHAPGLAELTANPLLLTMIANVHRYRGALPGSRAELYNEICQVMLWRRQEAKKLSSDLRSDRKETLLRGLAFTMMRERVRDFPRKQVLSTLKDALSRMATDVTADAFLTEVCSFGLVVERESDLFCFAHLTFQESLAAAHIRDKSLVDVLTSTVDDLWWRETSLLYAAQSDADPIVAACLQSGTVNALSLAFDCAEQSSDLDPDLRASLEDLLSGEDDSPERQRLRTTVQLIRHLRDRVGPVCARPISASVYELFLTDTGNPAPDGGGWTDPVAGVRASDAAAFVRWTNTITEDESGYRLPTADEMTAAQRLVPAEHTVWTGDGLWLPPAAKHPNALDAATLRQHIDNDLDRLEPMLRFLMLRRVAETAAEHVRQQVNHYSQLENDKVLERCAAWAKQLQYPRDLDSALVDALPIPLGLDDDIATAHGALASFRDAQESIRAAERKVVRQQANDAQDVPIDREWFSQLREFARQERHAMHKLVQKLTDLVRPNDTGRVLDSALAAAFRSKKPETWFTAFRHDFLNLSPVHDTVVSLDVLADRLAESARTRESDWERQVAHRFQAVASPMLHRELPLTAASTLRFTAMCLRLPEIAAGITLLERRAMFAAIPTETIFLARD